MEHEMGKKEKKVINTHYSLVTICRNENSKSYIYISLIYSLIIHCFFQYSCMDVRVGPKRKMSAEELMFLNCGVGEDS